MFEKFVALAALLEWARDQPFKEKGVHTKPGLCKNLDAWAFVFVCLQTKFRNFAERKAEVCRLRS